MKVLLVYPEYPDTFWSFKSSLWFVNKKAGFPPLGLLTIARMMPSEWDKKLVDMNVQFLTDEYIDWADYVFISAMIVQEKSVNGVIKRCKEKGKKIVAGGPLFTSQHQETQGVDHFIIGEAENIFSAFVADLKRGRAKRRYEFGEKPSLEKTPLPDWSLVNLQDYATACVQYSRGCPYLCEFCDIRIMFGQKPRVKSNEQFIQELDYLYRVGWRGTVFIVDDNFIGNKPKIKKLLPCVIEWQKKNGYPFQFLTEADITLGNDEHLLDLMSKANFFQVFVGVETPSEQSLKECSKGQNIRCNITQAIRRIQEKGINVLIGVIVGFDEDCHYQSPKYNNIFEAIIGSVQEWGTPVVMAGILSVLPGTDLEQRLRKQGRLLGRTNGENADILTFVPTIPSDELVSGYRRILKTVYSEGKYYERVETFLSHYSPTVKRKGLNATDIRAFLLSIFMIGLFSRDAYYYWKVLIKTLLKKPRALPEVVGLSIWHQHFKDVAKRITSN